MFRPWMKLTATLLAALFSLSACTLGQAPAPTPTPQDISAVYTRAAETARAELTQIAGLASPTLPPSATPTATSAPLVQVTLDASSAATATLLPTPILALEFTPTLAGGLPPVAGLETPTLIPSITPVSQGNGGSAGPVCKNSAFLQDVTIPDGTVLKAGEKFTKTWRMQNTGTCAWDDGFSFLAWAGPAKMTQDSYRIRLDTTKWVAPGAIVDISIEMVAPFEPGEYVAHYAWFDDTGKPFGGDFVAYIVVK